MVNDQEEEEAEEEEYDSDDDYVEYNQESISKPLSKLEIAKRKSKAKQKKKVTKPDDSADIEDLGIGVPQLDDPSNPALNQLIKQDHRKEMISPMTRKSLTKQGYAIVGSHSAVKTCRWTKASLRGRGFCYKHTFYGIQSHRCMEATPSLACANKCTFCWRAHTNPVGTSWRWKTDDAEFVIEESLKEHDRLIKQLLGMPGVRPDRFLEARTPKHAALSLVGEPVMYPHIKKYIQLLTEKRISTFLVTNAQFPDSLLNLPPVTQLYLSIDAGNKTSLKSIDRPLHRDFWERFIESIEIVKKMKNTRTVFRLTLVKGENSEEILDYVELIKRGEPDFIEVKGVTYCGYAPSSNLTIKNSPFHEEVVNFVQRLCYELNLNSNDPNLQYDLASEHAHSCCVLAAHKKYLIDDQWNTWIDYERFFDLVETNEKDFSGVDYSIPTPDFALFGSPEAGFSPEDVRWFRKGKGPKEEEEEEVEEVAGK
ncbi:Wyosine base formation-domain-containing protein [Melampsora americana]|nr:Wyosine base formation-domain-containing protein [Melampsora americana]